MGEWVFTATFGLDRKDERFHRTLKLEVLHQRSYQYAEVQSVFDAWRHEYNYKRPHEALGGKPPCLSARQFPDTLKEPEYTEGVIKKVHKTSGTFRFKGKRFRVGKGFAEQYIAIKETQESNVYPVFFMDNFIKKSD